jgi:hypothetical protein
MVWPVSVWIMYAMAAGPGFPLAPPSENIMRCLWMLVSSVFLFFSLLCLYVKGFFVAVVVQSHQFMSVNG